MGGPALRNDTTLLPGNSVADTSSTVVVDSWGSEKQFYDVSSACADKSQVWVCQYRPGGNMMGERPF